jgi:hypothetical protein
MWCDWVELSSVADKLPLEAEMTRERFTELGVVRGQRVWLAPRRARIFALSDNKATAHYDVLPSRSESEAKSVAPAASSELSK